jgi:hypothetical protein
MNKNEPLPIDNTGTGKLGSVRVEFTHCRGCNKETDMHRPIDQHYWARRDAYGIFTGIYCDDCFKSGDSNKYPYRKDDYHDPMYAGERLEPEDSLPWEY